MGVSLHVKFLVVNVSITGMTMNSMSACVVFYMVLVMTVCGWERCKSGSSLHVLNKGVVVVRVAVVRVVVMRSEIAGWFAVHK